MPDLGSKLSSQRPPDGQSQTSEPARGCQLFFEQAQQDFQFWLFAFLALGFLRGLMLVLFSKAFGPTVNTWEILKCFWAGMHYDASVVTFWALPCLLASGIAAAFGRQHWAERVRQFIGILFIVLSTTIGIIAIGFFAESKDHFNYWIFGVVFDDLKAILQTVWKDYPVLPLAIGGIVIMLALCLLLKCLLARPWLPPSAFAILIKTQLRQTLALALLVVLVVVGARGSMGRRPIQLKDAAICKDRVLNKLVLNPYSALRYAISQQLKIMHGSDLRVLWPSGDIREAVSIAFPAAPTASNLDSLTGRIAKGPPAAPARHLFLVVMESHDAWPLQDRFNSLKLGEGVRALAHEGLLIPAFVSAGSGTMLSVGALVTGLPEAGLIINYQPASRKSFPTSIAAIFKQLGYRTRAFYAGYLSWQRFGDFCAEQGFDEIHGSADMDETGSPKREWGVEDDKLFNYVARHVPDDTPSFNLILSAGYHPPYTMDVFARGYPLRQTPADLQTLFPNPPDLKILGHMWFADLCLSNFVLQTEKRLRSTVIAVTGDHWSRRFLNERPNTWERTAVLMLWRGLSVLPPGLQGNQLAGSHLDILPTLVELAAPAGFKYHAFGRNLFDQTQSQVGFGEAAIVTPGFIIDPAEPETVLTIPKMTERRSTPEEAVLLKRWQAWRALSWWRVIKGPAIAPRTEPP